MTSLLLSALMLGQAATLQQHVVSGSVAYRERIALTPSARVTIAIDRFDGSNQTNLSEVTIHLRGRQVPVSFNLPFMAGRDKARYGVRATIHDGGRLMFESPSATMITPGTKRLVNLMLVRAKPSTPQWTNVTWELMAMDGKRVEISGRMPSLNFEEGSGRLTGFGGVNRFSGTYSYNAPHAQIDLGPMTLMAGPPEAMELEGKLVQLLPMVNRMGVQEGELVLSRGAKELARFRKTK